MARLKNAFQDMMDHMDSAAATLQSLVEFNQDMEENIRLVATFAAEQLRLVIKPLHGRIYSSLLLM